MDVLIKKIAYIRGIPEWLTAKAVDGGEIKKGSIVGLNVEFKEYAVESLIELRLIREGQEKLIKEGALIPVEEAGSTYFMEDYWMNYAKTSQDVQKKKLPKKQGIFTKLAAERMIEPKSTIINGPVKSNF